MSRFGWNSSEGWPSIAITVGFAPSHATTITRRVEPFTRRSRMRAPGCSDDICRDWLLRSRDRRRGAGGRIGRREKLTFAVELPILQQANEVLIGRNRVDRVDDQHAAEAASGLAVGAKAGPKPAGAALGRREPDHGLRTRRDGFAGGETRIVEAALSP